MSTERCTINVNHSKVKVEEKKQKAVFQNETRDEYRVSRVDGCLIPRGTISADYLVSKVNAISVLVELKGTDVSHACVQLFNAVEHRSVKPLLEDRLGFLVVCNRYPRFDTFIARAKQHCAKKYKAGFHVVAAHGEFQIERVAAIDGPN